MTARCRTCEHPDRADIDVALARGFDCGTVAKRFGGINIWNLQRHKRNGHIPPSVIAAFPKHRSDLSAEALQNGELKLGRLEIARLDNDPNFRDRGVLRLMVEGGK